MKKTDDLLKKGLDVLDIPWTDSRIEAFGRYLFELKKWNRAYNLTGLRSDRDIIVKHFLDSLLFLKVLPEEVSAAADVGSGAGFPGIPIKIMTSRIKMYLVEPVGKKAIFLRHVCSSLDLAGIEIIDKRLEEVEGLKVDVAMTRALFTVGDFIEKARGHINRGGMLVLSKGPKFREELKGIGMRDIKVTDYRLPFDGAVRHLVVVRNVAG